MKTFDLSKPLIMTAVLTSMLYSHTSHAQNRSLNDRFQIFGGVWFVDQERKFLIEDPDTGSRISLDLENLGLDDSDETGLLGFLWRISNRFRLEVYGTSVDNSDTVIINPITIGGETLVPGGSARLSFSTDMAVARVGFSFISNEKGELGASLGLSYIDAEVRASGSVGTDATSVSDSVEGVIPTIGVYGAVALSEQWSVTGRVSALDISELGDIDKGSWVDVIGAVVYRPFKNVGFGLAYNWLDADVEGRFRDEGGEFKGKLEWDYKGPFGFIEIGFGALR